MQQAPNSSPRNALQSGYQLLWYQVRSVLGQGAFGITYLAQDVNLKRLVAIKEFLPGQYAMRDGNETVRPVSDDVEEKFFWGLKRFIDEARILDQFEHPNIVRITNIFEANNTAYLVMRYEQGVSLKEILIRQKFLDEADLLNILFPILNGLDKIHEAGFIHRDIKPANIYVRTDGTPVLLDFGSARQSLLKDTHTLTSLVSPGYAPIEQYVSKSDKQGPWSDVYGMAATLYRAVTGFPPNDAVTRGEALTGDKEDNLIRCRELADARYSDQFIAAIQHGLEFLTRDRPQSVHEWIEEFPELPAAGGRDEILPGHTSNQVLSIVRDSFTQTSTRINEQSNMPEFWQNDRATTSLEIAHKQGFHRGLKMALALLVLVIGGLFIGNIQKIKDKVSPGFVPQELISTAPEALSQGKSVEEITEMDSPLEPQTHVGIQTELKNDPLNPEPYNPGIIPFGEDTRMLDRETSQEIIPEVIDQQPAAFNPQPNYVEQTNINQSINQTTQDVLLDDQVTDIDTNANVTDAPIATTFFDVPPGAVVDDEPLEPDRDPDEGVIYFEDTYQEIVTEIPSEAPPEPVKEIPSAPQKNRAVYQQKTISEVSRTQTPVYNDPKVINNKKPVARESGVTIEEYKVPVKPKKTEPELLQRFRNWIEYLNDHGQKSKQSQGGSASDKNKNAKSAKGSNL